VYLKKISLLSDTFPTHEHYPFNLPAFHQTRALDFNTPVTFLIGQNGTGKSTLLEALARKSGIHIWRNTETRRFVNNPYEDKFYLFLDAEWAGEPVNGSFFASEIFKHFAQNLDEWASSDPGILKYFGGASLMTQSHGQSLMSFFKSRYKIKGLYLLDEPETALSPNSQIELLKLLRDMSRAGHAQFIVVTHSPILLACPDAVIYSFDHVPLKQIAYEDTDYYRIYKDFLDNRDRYL